MVVFYIPLHLPQMKTTAKKKFRAIWLTRCNCSQYNRKIFHSRRLLWMSSFLPPSLVSPTSTTTPSLLGELIKQSSAQIRKINFYKSVFSLSESNRQNLRLKQQFLPPATFWRFIKTKLFEKIPVRNCPFICWAKTWGEHWQIIYVSQGKCSRNSLADLTVKKCLKQI